MTKVELSIRAKKGSRVIRLNRIKSRVIAVARRFLNEFAYVSISLVSDSEIRKINYRYLGRNCATDVIAFDLGIQPGKGEGSKVGEIVVSIDTARRQAKNLGLSLRQELLRLIVHGIVHLAGYDDAKGVKKRLDMREAEIRVLQMLL